ncbi:MULTISPECIES: homoserine kinase [Psychrobacter]|jgi:homoserine kinase type II|uniref:Homoserine kinase n=2 Tax=Psychrobacter TaxID=497 RepID=A0A1G6Y1V9_9GAMM|nr:MULTISPECIES: homoserine kinase [Psychrobacter]MED6317822.1 homoserine kinase [Pseudomonadota bacterium]HCI31665.1 homoserine kinase [Psychrobacter sp.]MDH4903540.1 homoserine kinase [Psychrobacter pocilloporae]SDD84484.1 homoserine kinase [Psychrobacter pacificensis]GLR29566.1 homoserine kinase [Psychrobacter pacificensis]|tara:strand:- start:366 stop:1532 length:1167 start_codon:yes stop_codon:yes gene_type:complete
MSVYTQLTDDQFAAFCQSFGVSFARAIPITQGIKNSNWFIQTTDDVDGTYSYVFTLFEERPPADIEKMAVILNQLNGKLPVAAPLAVIESNGSRTDGDDKRYVIHYEDKAITLVPCLAGSHPEQTTQAMCHDIGAALATLHETLQALQPSEQYGVPLYPWSDVRDREMQFMPGDEGKLMSDIWRAYSELPLDTLPKGLCHLDMFADNTLWNLQKGEARLTGLLDFTEVSVEHYVMDIAITINDFCTTWGGAEQGESVNFDRSKMAAFLQGYESIRPLNGEEKRALPVMLAKAAVIFWLLRLNVIHYNRTEGRTGDNIMVKNPDLMKRLAAYHWAHVEKSQNTVFVLLSKPDNQIVGVFSSITQAEQAHDHLTNTNDFTIETYTLDQLA